MRQNQTYSVYMLIDPRDRVARYVGCSENINSRLKVHLWESNRSTEYAPKNKKTAWLKELTDNGLEPEVVIVFRTKHKRLAYVVEQAFQGALAETITNHHCADALPTTDMTVAIAVIRHLAIELRAMSKSILHHCKRGKVRKEDARWWATHLVEEADYAIQAIGMPEQFLRDKPTHFGKYRRLTHPTQGAP